jgi:hypothetical protein
MSWSIVQADAIDFLRSQPADSIDLVFGSPPYEQARLYLEDGVNMGISRKTDAWVPWMVEVYLAAQAACKGLVAFVVAGQTRNYRWSAGPALLMAELHRAGLNLRNPPIFSRVGIPGSGGPDWLRADYEWIVCTSRPGKLPWSDNTAMGHPPKWAPGGEMSHRLTDGTRVGKWGHPPASCGLKADGSHAPAGPAAVASSTVGEVRRRATRGKRDGDTVSSQEYKPPVLANPGNIIERTYTTAEVAELMGEMHDRIHLNVGGHLLGSDFAHENEAPFPGKLAEFFVLSYCPPGGVVCDPFSGSGTTAVTAKRHGRNFVGCDLRASQVALGLKRLGLETQPLF